MKYFPCTFVAALAALTTVCHAIDFELWVLGGCFGGSMRCGNLAYGSCCKSSDPFCSSGSCDGCVVENDIYGFDQARCDIGAHASCRAAVGNGCCVDVGHGRTCAISANRGAARTVSRVVDAERCEVSAHPNNLVYTDPHDGTEHSIHIPTGTFDTVVQHYINQNWTVLNAFPVWGKLELTPIL